MKKKLLLFCFLMLTAVLLSACDKDPTTPTETTPAVTEEPKKPDAVFLDGENGKDEQDGLSPETAVLSLSHAFELLSPERNRIVIMNSPQSEIRVTLPEYDGTLIFTSKYNGIDYAEQNKARFRIPHTLTLGGDTVFEDLTMASYSEDSRIFCNYHNLTIAESVSCTGADRRLVIIHAGYSVADTALNDEKPIYARNLGHNGDCEINIFGGRWKAFCGGNYRAGRNSPVATFDGNLTVNIGGNAEFYSIDPTDDIWGDHFTATGMNFQRGTVTLNITGGTFSSPIYALGHRGEIFCATAANGKTGTDGTKQGRNVTYTADVTVNISGGTFTEGVTEIGALRNPGETPLTGSYTLNITGGSFTAGIKLSARGILGESKVTGAPADACVVDFDTVNGAVQSAAKALRVACVGDSITFGTCAKNTELDGYLYVGYNFSYPAMLQKLCGDTAVIGNFGYPGANVMSSAYYNTYYNSCVYNLFEEFRPDIILFALGTNNTLFMPDKLVETKSAYNTLLKGLHTSAPDAKIIMTTALYRFDKPEREEMLVKYIRPLQKELAESYDYIMLFDSAEEFRPYGNVSYYQDKLHPNNKGYGKLAEIMNKAIAEFLPASADGTK